MKVAVVSYKYNLSIGSMTNSMLWLLAEYGNDVDVFIDRRSHEYCSSYLEHTRINMRFMDGLATSSTLVDRILAKTDHLDDIFAHLPAGVRTTICSRPMGQFSTWLRQEIAKGDYDLILAIEARSLASLHWCTDIPIIYVNMELLGWEKDVWRFPHKQLLKRIECDMLRRVGHVFITSPTRGDIFARINNYPRDKVTVLPAVPMRGTVTPHADFFRKKFGIPADKHIILHTGHIVRWALCHDIIKTMPRWPKDCVLVLHTWSEAAVDPAYLAELRVLAHGLPVHFSFENLPYSAISDAWASADIGLAFYEEIDSNFTEILFSSNKFGEYMKAGLPVICSPLPSLASFVGEHGVGQAVPTSNVPMAISAILADQNGYKARIARCHEKFFLFERYFEQAYALIQQAAQSR